MDDFEFSDFEANVTWVASATDKVVAEASPGEPPRIGLLVGYATLRLTALTHWAITVQAAGRYLSGCIAALAGYFITARERTREYKKEEWKKG